MEIRNHIRRWTLVLASMLLLGTSAMLMTATLARADTGALPGAVTSTSTAEETDQASAGVPATASASPTSTAPGSTTGADPVPAAPSDQPSDSAGQQGSAVAQSPTPMQSNTTAQAIGQVQTQGCIADCAGTTQAQSAQQQNTTTEVVPPDQSPQAGPATRTSTTNITQLQLGCVAHCFGTTTISTDPQRAKQTIDRLLNTPSVPTLPAQNPVAADQQNAVDQSAFQSQYGDGRDPQSQSARQTNATEQTSAPDSPVAIPGLSTPDGQSVPGDQSQPGGQSPFPSGTPETAASFDGLNSAVLSVLSTVADLFATTTSDSPPTSTGAAPTDPASPSDGMAPTAPASSAGAPLTAIVNEAEQGIWQIQIGCLLFCTGTQQSQQATQSDTNILMTPTPPAFGGSGSATIVTDQLIWQLQVGCLFWCYDATEEQTASATATVLTEPLPGPPSTTPSDGTPPPPPTTQVPAPISSPAASNAPIGPVANTVPIGPVASTAPIAPVGGEVVGDPGRVAAVALPAPRIENPRAAGRASGSSAGFLAGTASPLALEPITAANPARSSRTHSRPHRGRQSKPDTAGQQAPALTLPGNSASDEPGLVMLGLAALIAILLAGDWAWRRHRVRPLT